MSLKDISTKFEQVETISIPHTKAMAATKWECYKAVGDTIYQVVVRTAVDAPFYQMYGIKEIKFMSAEKYLTYIDSIKHSTLQIAEKYLVG